MTETVKVKNSGTHKRTPQAQTNPAQVELGTVQAQPNTTQAQTSLSGCLVRMGWMVYGAAVLYISAVFIAKHHGFLSLADVVFWSAVTVCIGLRYVDIKHFHGQTAAGESATMAHWRRYVLLLSSLALGLWVLAHLIAYLFK